MINNLHRNETFYLPIYLSAENLQDIKVQYC